MPPRPGFGTQGRKVMLWANSFPLVFQGLPAVHRYSVEVLAAEERGRVPTGKKLSRVVQLLLEEHFPGQTHEIASDFKSNLISRTELDLAEEGYLIPYRGDHDEEAAPGAPTYRVRVQETGTLSVSDLVNYLTSTGAGALLHNKEELLQCLNIILGHFPKAAPGIASIGPRKHFQIATATRMSLGAGLEALQGFFFSVRAATARIIVNVQVKNAAFFEEGPLDRLMRAYLGENGPNKVRLGQFVKGLSVNPTHIVKKNKKGQVVPRVKKVAGLATPNDGQGDPHPPKVRGFGAGPRDVLFFRGGASEAPASQPSTGKKKGKKPAKAGPDPPSTEGYISVYDFFQETYNITIQDPALPVINVGSRQRPSYLPAQICDVLAGQPSVAKLSPSQTQQMIRFAVRKPPQNAQSIVTSGLQTLGVGSPDSNLGPFGLELIPKLTTVVGRVLNCPDVRYGGNKSIRPKFGSWNMQSIQFSAKAELPYWSYLWLSYPTRRDPWRDDQALQPTIDAFTAVLRETGINAGNCIRGQHVTVQDVDQDLEHAIRAFTSHAKPPKFILVILPAVDTALYNRVKYLCDVQEGLLNVCAVANKFAKPNNAQYFANVALKVNLKLGGRNQLVDPSKLGVVGERKTMVVGIDVTHPSPGSSSEAPSVAGVVASIDHTLAQWPADLRVQPARQEMVADLGPMLQSRLRLWSQHNGSYPQNVLVYRDGVSEGQYDIVLEKELPALRTACRELYPAHLTKQGYPRMTIVVVGKRHHHRFYPTKAEDADRSTNPQNGTVVDRGVTEARNWDFFLQAHTALQGTARPAHYYIVYDEIFRVQKVQQPLQNAADALEDLTHNMCYLFGRATKAVSICPPAYYADLVCERARCYLSKLFDPSSVPGSEPSVSGERRGGGPGAELNRVSIHDRVRDAMFYI
ncbi:ribonuclease H-like domain-containing protein [Aspergillus avenaceus]|uniref:Ribonuclease H-like domain-containing protein n=1 Tax=Aspergillus avenaceus TaxID=36643 RepID=A0A5N6U4Z9_ASPAV|nr:ribonuclease H-like domain-containing protein [Aspergillus avenaceus]